jgi:hypothetical protein
MASVPKSDRAFSRGLSTSPGLESTNTSNESITLVIILWIKGLERRLEVGRHNKQHGTREKRETPSLSNVTRFLDLRDLLLQLMKHEFGRWFV